MSARQPPYPEEQGPREGGPGQQLGGEWGGGWSGAKVRAEALVSAAAKP